MTTPKKPEREYKKREHRYSKLTMAELLRTRMDELNVKNIDMQAALGYPQANVIAMMKMGNMRIPEGKALDVARVLQLDPGFILEKLLTENNPGLWGSIQVVMGNRLMSEAEFGLVKFVRAELEGFEVDFVQNAEVVGALKPVLAKLKKSNVTDLAKRIADLDAQKKKKKPDTDA